MSLAKRFSNYFTSSVRNRGYSYFVSGAVRIQAGTDLYVEAAVKGSERYIVDLSYDSGELIAACECPYFESNLDFCKHIWATMLAADRFGHLGALKSVDRVELILDDPIPIDYPEDDQFNSDLDSVEVGEASPVTLLPAAVKEQSPGAAAKTAKAKPAKPPAWKQQLVSVRQAMIPSSYDTPAVWPARREIIYVVDIPSSFMNQNLVLEVSCRERKMNGEWGQPRQQGVPYKALSHLPDPLDREIISSLQGAKPDIYGGGYYDYGNTPSRYGLPTFLQRKLIPMICQTGRCRLRLSPRSTESTPILWDDGPAWELWLECELDESKKEYVIQGSLRRGEERRGISEPKLFLHAGLVFDQDHAARFEDQGAFPWVKFLRQSGKVSIPFKHNEELFQELVQMPYLPRLDLPDGLRFEEVALTPRPQLRISSPQNKYGQSSQSLHASVSFDYDGVTVPSLQPGRGVFHRERRCLIRRDMEAERAAVECLRNHGLRQNSSSYNDPAKFELSPKKLPAAVQGLVKAGWHVEAEGKLYRQPGAFRCEVRSGIDWFELHGEIEFGDKTIKLPALLAALRRGETMVRLDDGTFGLLPEEWMKKYGLLAGLGNAQEDHVQFSRAQVGLLDALLASQPEVTCDAVFSRAREELRRFEGVEPLDTTLDFTGTLRTYQREGLGWLHFLQQFGFGGCLADDMGLGKTVQVLALLEFQRAQRGGGNESNPVLRTENSASEAIAEIKVQSRGVREAEQAYRPRPSLIVVPRSLIFNWTQESLRFAPKLRVLDHTGTGRIPSAANFNDYDVVLTTYGTLRRDIVHLKDVLFDYAILDEAQAIKNAATESAKAARLLKANHRLALSGTPVENHLGELWSLFEFLNPGLLGSASVFRLTGAGQAKPDEETRTLLARALRPFILRRTKNQVARDLPSKLEQTIYCELETSQRKLYDELRDHYRQSLLFKLDTVGLQKSKIHVLEALLRLRQAACHPGLIDKSRTSDSSAKLDFLLPQLCQVIDEGHKALVFSQFTSLLAIVRRQLDQDSVPYAYLDGQTRDRAARVERFQNDPECKLFLISLKAGGLGLNLTAAEYVYLLDPWWNPAVEAQAIDRSHRIGQTRQVFAYRLIARDTVEEKVLELQKSKRDLADAIINADNSLIRNLSREDLELLLG